MSFTRLYVESIESLRNKEGNGGISDILKRDERA